MERKIIRVSDKRQITIPQKYFEALGFDSEAECVLREDGVLIRPTRTHDGGAFAEQILAELIAEGCAGPELLSRFQQRSRQIRPAVLRLIAEADARARDGGGASLGELFGAGE